MERNSTKARASTSKGLFRRSKFTPEMATKRKFKVPLSENTKHNKRYYQEHLQRKRNIDVEMDKIKIKIGNTNLSFQSDGTWQSAKSNQKPITTDMLKLKKNFEKLESDNLKLKLSYELLLNMVVTKNHHIEQLEADVKKLRGILNKPSLLFPESYSD